MAKIDESLEELSRMYSLVGGDRFETWWRTKENEGLHEIAMHLSEESESTMEGRNAEMAILDYWDLLEDEGLMENGMLTETGENWASRTETGIIQIYESDMVSYDAEGEPGEGAFYPDDLRSIGGIYGVLGTPGALQVMTAAVNDELEEIDPYPDATEVLGRNGFLDDEAYRRGETVLDESAEDLYRRLVDGEGGDYRWARENL